MSAAPFDPTSSYLPDSGSPDVDVMRPADQAPTQAAPQPAADPSSEPSYPAAPGDNPNTHGWRAVLKGALSGLENHLKGAGEGLVAGGIPGAIVGAVNPAMADRALQYRGDLQRAQVQQAQAAARSAQQDTQFQAENHDVQLAQSQIHLQQLQASYDSMPKTFQDRLLQEGSVTTRTASRSKRLTRLAPSASHAL